MWRNSSCILPNDQTPPLHLLGRAQIVQMDSPLQHTDVDLLKEAERDSPEPEPFWKGETPPQPSNPGALCDLSTMLLLTLCWSWKLKISGDSSFCHMLKVQPHYRLGTPASAPATHLSHQQVLQQMIAQLLSSPERHQITHQILGMRFLSASSLGLSWFHSVGHFIITE